MVVSLDSLERGNACKTYLVSCDLYFRIYISRNLCRFIFENQSEFGEFLGIAKFCCTAQLGAAKQQKIARSSTKICQCFMIFIVLIATCCSLELWTCWCIAYDCKPGAKMLCKWQNWATLRGDMHLGWCRDVVLKSGSGHGMLVG